MIEASDAKRALDKLVPSNHDQYEAWFYVEQFILQQQLKEKKVAALLGGNGAIR